MKAILTLSTLLMLAFAGCTGTDDSQSTQAAACPSSSLQLQAFTQGEQYMEDLVDAAAKPFAMVMEGTVEGEIGTVSVAYNPATKAAQIDGFGMSATMVDGTYTYEDDQDRYLSRDYDPAVSAEQSIRDMFSEDELGIDFASELSYSDYTATCTTLGGIEAIQYRYEQGGMLDVITLERAAPHRFLAMQSIDPALQNNYRVSISYDAPQLSLDMSLPKAPVGFAFDVDQMYQNSRGGVFLEATLNDETEWGAFAEMEIHLIDEAGNVYYDDPLTARYHDMGDGDYITYQDNDFNQMFSTGDSFEMDVGYGYDVMFFDKWADDYAILYADEIY